VGRTCFIKHIINDLKEMYNSDRVILGKLIVTQLITNSTLFWDLKSPQEPLLD